MRSGSSLPSTPPAWPIIVAGGGPVGACFALALAGGLGRSVSVTICDPAPPRPAGSAGRAYALSPAGVSLFRALGIWREIETVAQPISAMAITDGRTTDAVRLPLLSFPADTHPLAFMVEEGALAPVLEAACRRAGVERLATAVSGFAARPDGIDVALADGAARSASLLVAADGTRSRLRTLAGIPWYGFPYNQSGLVATVHHERDHEGRAVQHFLPGGPFAILPLTPENGRHRSSIVWTERQDAVPALLAVASDDLMRQLDRRFGPDLGTLSLASPVKSFPLGLGLARRYVAPRVALLGDAAHQIHPLAGLGLNLGLADGASLAEHMADAVRLGLDPGSLAVGESFERDRRFDAVALAAATDGLNRLFSNDFAVLRAVRDIGLGLVERSPLRAAFARGASGRNTRTPRLMRGEAL